MIFKNITSFVTFIILMLVLTTHAHAVSATNNVKIVDVYAYNNYIRVQFDAYLSGPYCRESTYYATIPVDGTQMNKIFYTQVLVAKTTQSTVYVELDSDTGQCTIGNYPQIKGFMIK